MTGRAGRPTDFNQEIADLLCERIANGESLRSICEEDGMPNKSTVFRWLAAHEDFATIYARARDVQAEVMADELLDIADNGSNDWMEKNYGEDTRWVENGESMRRSQIRIAARQWIAERMLPKKYGTKQHLEHSGKIETADIDNRQLSRAILAVLGEAALEDSPEE